MKHYSMEAVNEYMDRRVFGILPFDEIPGTLLDTYIIYHADALEVFQETPLNEWSSAYTRHVYRSRKPVPVLNEIAYQAHVALSEDDPGTVEQLYTIRENIVYHMKGIRA